jgi:hypothetical protein
VSEHDFQEALASLLVDPSLSAQSVNDDFFDNFQLSDMEKDRFNRLVMHNQQSLDVMIAQVDRKLKRVVERFMPLTIEALGENNLFWEYFRCAQGVHVKSYLGPNLAVAFSQFILSDDEHQLSVDSSIQAVCQYEHYKNTVLAADLLQNIAAINISSLSSIDFQGLRPLMQPGYQIATGLGEAVNYLNARLDDAECKIPAGNESLLFYRDFENLGVGVVSATSALSDFLTLCDSTKTVADIIAGYTSVGVDQDKVAGALTNTFLELSHMNVIVFVGGAVVE